jgi:acetyl esterase/lipase
MVTRVLAIDERQPQDFEASPVQDFNPDPKLILQSPPPLDPAWLAHEKAAGLLTKAAITDAKTRRKAYSQACRDRNACLLSGRDQHLNHGIHISDTFVAVGTDRYHPGEREPYSRARRISIRSYNPPSWPSGPPDAYWVDGKAPPEGPDIVIYYHGGGLAVGDLDSEDLTCRRICKELGCTVYSCDYRLMPDHTADQSCEDALEACASILRLRRGRRVVLAGSSSGGQLAAMVAGNYGRTNSRLVPWRHLASSSVTDPHVPRRKPKNPIHGVLLRGPVTCDASGDGSRLPSRFRPYHTSTRPEFHTSLLSALAVVTSTRTTHRLPLEDDDFSKLPRHWIQVCTNDILYSDGVLYSEALRQAGVEAKLDVVEGFPHTFWLKAPELDRAVKAEIDMIEGLRWLLDSPEADEGNERNAGEQDSGKSIGRNYVPLSEEEFERKFLDI